MEQLRIDKFLWAARFVKTRALAQQVIGTGRARIDGESVKPARMIRPGTVIELRLGRIRRRIEVLALSEKRGPAAQAQTLYRDLDPPVQSGIFDDED
ncbi:MAG: RNA-binding S4 domain-containing protein [Paracoccus sp. (in: a-proteobacteria)]|nr:RNA-binding S4 domain-containing protein [Paracoccus sp. (in: a-proteobacteria)]